MNRDRARGGPTPERSADPVPDGQPDDLVGLSEAALDALPALESSEGATGASDIVDELVRELGVGDGALGDEAVDEAFIDDINLLPVDAEENAADDRNLRTLLEDAASAARTTVDAGGDPGSFASFAEQRARPGNDWPLRVAREWIRRGTCTRAAFYGLPSDGGRLLGGVCAALKSARIDPAKAVTVDPGELGIDDPFGSPARDDIPRALQRGVTARMGGNAGAAATCVAPPAGDDDGGLAIFVCHSLNLDGTMPKDLNRLRQWATGRGVPDEFLQYEPPASARSDMFERYGFVGPACERTPWPAEGTARAKELQRLVCEGAGRYACDRAFWAGLSRASDCASRAAAGGSRVRLAVVADPQHLADPHGDTLRLIGGALGAASAPSFVPRQVALSRLSGQSVFLQLLHAADQWSGSSARAADRELPDRLRELKTWAAGWVASAGSPKGRAAAEGLAAASAMRVAAREKFGGRSARDADRRAADLLARDGMGLLARVTVEGAVTGRVYTNVPLRSVIAMERVSDPACLAELRRRAAEISAAADRTAIARLAQRHRRTPPACSVYNRIERAAFDRFAERAGEAAKGASVVRAAYSDLRAAASAGPVRILGGPVPLVRAAGRELTFALPTTLGAATFQIDAHGTDKTDGADGAREARRRRRASGAAMRRMRAQLEQEPDARAATCEWMAGRFPYDLFNLDGPGGFDPVKARLVLVGGPVLERLLRERAAGTAPTRARVSELYAEEEARREPALFATWCEARGLDCEARGLDEGGPPSGQGAAGALLRPRQSALTDVRLREVAGALYLQAEAARGAAEDAARVRPGRSGRPGTASVAMRRRLRAGGLDAIAEHV